MLVKFPWFRFPVSCLLLTGMPVLSFTQEGTSDFLVQEDVVDYGWGSRRLSLEDLSASSGTSRSIQQVEEGWWGEAQLELGSGGLAAAYRRPGERPLESGSQVSAVGTLHAAWGPLFLSFRPEYLISLSDKGNQKVPDGDARQEWLSNDKEQGQHLARIQPVWRGTAGVAGLGHVLVFSNEDFQWGDGIFGGLLFARRWRGFPHVAVIPQRAWRLDEVIGIPSHVSYEAVYGGLTADRVKGDNPTRVLAFRGALRFWDTTFSGNVSVQHGGPGQHTPGITKMFQFETGRENRDEETNRIISFGIRQSIGGQFALSIEYGLDDWNATYKSSGNLPDLGQLGYLNPQSAAWIITADWLAVAGDEDWRVAAEWFRSEGYYYAHGRFVAWSDHEAVISHPDGGNANSVRFMLQHLLEDGGRLDVLGTWRRLGWRNGHSPGNTSWSGRNGQPGTTTVAEREWDMIQIALRRSSPIRYGELVGDIGIELHDNYRFDAGRNRLGGWLTTGFRTRF